MAGLVAALALGFTATVAAVTLADAIAPHNVLVSFLIGLPMGMLACGVWLAVFRGPKP